MLFVEPPSPAEGAVIDRDPSPPAPSQSPNRRRIWLFRAILAVGLLLVVELAAWLVLWVAAPALGVEARRTGDIYEEQTGWVAELLEPGPGRREVLDSTLGWRYRPGFRLADDAVNAQGLRADREYPQAAGPGILRVAAFGDSFVYGNEVGNADAWAAQVEAEDSTIEVLNYGVGGYGTDQAYLRYLEEGDRLRPHVVLIGFAPVDLPRVVNVYRRFLSDRDLPLFKPRFALDEAGQLALVPNPMRSRGDYLELLDRPEQVAEHGHLDHWYQPLVYENPFHDVSATVRIASAVGARIGRRTGTDRLLADGTFNENSEAFRIQIAVFDSFATAVEKAGAIPVILLLPDREAVERARAGRRPASSTLRDAVERRGHRVLDVTDAFAARAPAGSVDAWFAPGGHYSAEGNRIAAGAVLDLLQRLPARRGPFSNDDE